MTEAIQAVEEVTAIVGSILVDSALTGCALPLCVWFERSTDNVQHNLIQELMLYEVEMGDNVTETTKDVHCTKVDDAMDHIVVTRRS